MPAPTESQQPKLFDEVRNVLCLHHYSIHTERSYVDRGWQGTWKG